MTTKQKNAQYIESFEKKLWGSACILRGNMDASEYKQIILGLIFLKYISDSFEKCYQELVLEGDGFENDPDAYLCQNIFYVPKEARWSVIAQDAHNLTIGQTIDNAMQAIEKNNPSLKGILPKTFSRMELDKRRLGSVVDIFTNSSSMVAANNISDVLGRAYEYCLAKFAEQEGRLAGEFYTPACIVKTLVEVIKPYKGRVYDPCCGSGGMFVQSTKFIANHAGNLNDVSIYGQDSNPTTWKLCRMNLAIRGISADLGQFNADTFLDDCHPTLKADYILANPPFNLSNWGTEYLQADARWQYGVPPANNANFAWMQHMIYHLKGNGKIGLVLANGSLSSQNSSENKIRKNIVLADLVECIIAMPPQLFYTTKIPVSLWFLNNNKTRKKQTLFIDAREMGYMLTRKLRKLSDTDISKIAFTVDSFQKNENYQDISGFCAIATTQEIAEQDYILTPGRYVGKKPLDDDKNQEPFNEKMSKLTKELAENLQQCSELDQKIKQSLQGLGYEI